MNAQYLNKLNLEKGLQRQSINKSIIEDYFNLALKESLYPYSNFDYFDENKHIVIELKSFNRKYNYFGDCHLKTNKVVNPNSIFVFEFLTDEGYELYYLRYTTKFFNTLEHKFITYKIKTIQEEFFIIPNEYLIKIKKIDMKAKIKYKSHISQLIELDKQKYNKYVNDVEQPFLKYNY